MGKGLVRCVAALSFVGVSCISTFFAVWLDQNDPSAKAPLYSGKVVIKVSRLSFEGGAAAPTAASTGAPAASPQAAQHQRVQSAPTAKSSAPAPAPAPADDGDILNLGSSSPAPAAVPQAASGDGQMDEFWGL